MLEKMRTGTVTKQRRFSSKMNRLTINQFVGDKKMQDEKTISIICSSRKERDKNLKIFLQN